MEQIDTGILVVTWNFPPRRGGIESLIAGLCSHLRETHPLSVITSFAAPASAREEWICRPRWPGLISFFLYALWQGSHLLRHHPEIRVILGGSALVTPLVVLLAKIFRRKAAVLVHGLDLLYPRTLYQVCCVRWIKHCDRVIANSRYTASLAKAKKAKGQAISVIPPGVECALFPPFSAEEAKRAIGVGGRKILLYVGRLARRKGVGEFLRRCFADIVAEVPEICFLIVGENPLDSLVHRQDILGEIKSLLRTMGLENHVRLLGWLYDRDLVRVYQCSDLMVLPALSVKDDVEGFGIAILEAATAGKPSVATRVGGIPDAIEDGKSGVLVSPEDYDVMSRTIVRLLRDDTLRCAMGEYAQKRAREEFDWQSVVGKYEQMFDSLLTSQTS